MTYRPRYDWLGEKPAAMVYLERSVRIRLTDPNKVPVADGRCRVSDDPENVYPINEKGIAVIPVGNRWQKQLSLEWEYAESDIELERDRFYFKGTFDLEAVYDASDSACEKRLEHLGFSGTGLDEQVRNYQSHFSLEQTGTLADIRDKLVDWHDGGNCPDTATVDYSVRLTDPSGNPVSFCNWSAQVGKETLNGTSDDEGWIELSVPAYLRVVPVQWDNPGNEDTPTYSCELYLSKFDEADSDAEKLNNLGLLGSSREAKLVKARARFGYSAETSDETIIADLLAWHDGGDMPNGSSSASTV